MTELIDQRNAPMTDLLLRSLISHHLKRVKRCRNRRPGIRKMLADLLHLTPQHEIPSLRKERVDVRVKATNAPNWRGDYIALVRLTPVWFQLHIPLSCVVVVTDAYFLPPLMEWLVSPLHCKMLREWPLLQHCLFLNGADASEMPIDPYRRRCANCHRVELDVKGALEEGVDTLTLHMLRELTSRHLLLSDCPCGTASYCSKECQRLDWSRHRPEHQGLLPQQPLELWSHRVQPICGLVKESGQTFVVVSLKGPAGGIVEQLPARFVDNLD